MATEQGIVIRTDSKGAWVKTVKTGSCEGCTARGSCHSLAEHGEMEVNAINEAGAKVGDRIVLSFETSSLLKATFLLYVFPILLLVIGAAIGQASAPYFGLNPSGFAAILAFSFFFAAVLTVKLKADRLARKNAYRPKIIKVINPLGKINRSGL
jgi:sigma-E factor negative regulatory protein RseC